MLDQSVKYAAYMPLIFNNQGSRARTRPFRIPLNPFYTIEQHAFHAASKGTQGVILMSIDELVAGI